MWKSHVASYLGNIQSVDWTELLNWTTGLPLELEVLYYNNILVLICSLMWDKINMLNDLVGYFMWDKISMLNDLVISNLAAYHL